ncbi:MAG: beta-N-acetylhexosaminidase [Promethearchaeota archaeon]
MSNHLNVIVNSDVIIPRPVFIEERGGEFKFNQNTEIWVDAACRNIGDYARNIITPPAGPVVQVKEKSSFHGENIITLHVDEDDAGIAELGAEGYDLVVEQGKVDIRSSTPQGVFYGFQTLRQLVPRDVGHVNADNITGWEIHGIHVKDYPRFPWRGFMLDTARHFFEIEAIFRLLEAMALFKMNTFHWGLTNDQGWRIQIDRYPKLVEVGSKRKESQVGGFLSRKYDGKPYGGYYTRDDVRDVVAFAEARFIKVIPEINMPGHCMAALAAYPELSCTGGPFDVATKSGIKKDVYCVGKEKTFEFLQGVLDEIIELFPSDIIHIGGDEVPRARWKECPDCQARMKSEGLKDESELQVYFSNRMIEYVKSKGKHPMGWNEILDRGLDNDAIGQYWLRGIDKVLYHLRHGGRMVMSHFMHVYLDYNYGFIPLRKVYSYEIIPKKLETEHHGNVLGVETPMWTEFAETEEHMNRFVFPRLVAVAENGWTPENRKDYDSFKQRLGGILPRLDSLGLKYTSIELADPRGWKRFKLYCTFYKQSSEIPR